MSYDNDDSSVFALTSPTSFSSLLLLSQTSPVLCVSDPVTFSLPLAKFKLPSSSFFCLDLFSAESYLGVFLGIAFSIVFLGPLRLYLLGLFLSGTTRR